MRAFSLVFFLLIATVAFGQSLPVAKPVPLPNQLTFAGEPVPMEDPEVAERLDRELLVNTYWQSNTLLWLKRAGKWLPSIRQILVDSGIPVDFQYLPLIESNLINVVSPAEAVGFWQLLKSTAQENGMEVNEHVDMRYHPLEATRTACRVLKRFYEKLGSWTLAAAAYNMGLTGVMRQMNVQMERNYYRLWLNPETSRYVFRMLSAKLILENPTAFGFAFHASDAYKMPEFRVVEVVPPIPDWAAWAQSQGVSYKDLRYYNTWIRKNELPNAAGKAYEVLVPVTK